MTANDLIAAFETIAESPHGVKRLRELVLHLAVRGKLVKQDPVEQPIADVLGARAVHPRAEPWLLPKGWAWSSIEALGDLLGGGTPSKANSKFWIGTIPWVSPKDMKVAWLSDSQDHVSSAAVEGSAIRLVPTGSVLMVVRGMILAHSFPVAVTRVEVTVNQDMKALVPFRNDLAPYLLMLLQASRDRVLGAVERSTHGTCKLPLASLATLPLAMPPLAEQHRVVARVDELMGLLDRLETTRATRDEDRRAALAAALAALRAADNTDAIDAAWGRIVQQTDVLFAGSEDLGPLRHTILQLATRGRLTRQDPNDEPASLLIGRISVEKHRLLAIGESRGEREIATRQPPATRLPPSWCWSSLGSILSEVRNGASSSPNDQGIGTRVLRISAATSGGEVGVDLTDYKHTDVPPEEVAPFLLRRGDLLACRFNGNLHFVGRAALVIEDPAAPTAYPDKLIRLRPVFVVPAYLRYALNSESVRKQIESMAATTAGNIGINGNQLRSLLIPVPPLAEQRRIVAKVDALMAICLDLEARLTAAGELHGQFAAAAVHHLDV